MQSKYVKIKIKGKTHKLKTDSNGIVKIKSTRFKVGKHKITAHNPSSGETRKLSVVVLKKGVHKADVKIFSSQDKSGKKKLKNGDYLLTNYLTSEGADNGMYLFLTGPKAEGYTKHTKFIKAKFYFKNKYTGKIITKTSTNIKRDLVKLKIIKGYTPYKATVSYRDVK